MNKFTAVFFLLFLNAGICRATYVPLPVTTGFNADVIANGIGSGTVTTNNDVDGVSYAFVAQGWQTSASVMPTSWGLPANGAVNSAVAATSGLIYNLAAYTGNNVLRIATNGTSGTIVFGYQPKANAIYVLATSGSGISYFTGQINFTDNTSQAIVTAVVVPDWFGGTTQPTALGGFGRVNRTTDAMEPNTADPRLYQIEIAVDAANQSKQVASIEFTKATTSATGAVLNIFAVSARITSTNDAGVSALVAPVNFCPGNRDVRVNVRNFGNNVVNNVQVNWSMNGTTQTPVSLTLPLDTTGGSGINVREVLLGSYNFSTAAVPFKAWTSLPNGTADTFNFNDSLSANLQAALSGIYTINSNTVTGGTNYQSFTEFANALNTFGVCGSVVANVVSGSGPYVETVTFGNIAGASDVNNIKINGNGATVQFNTTTANRQLLTLNGTKYMSIDSLTFKTLGTDFGWGALLIGGAYKDSITRCVFDLTSLTTTASANANGIVFSNSTSSATTAGTNGSRCYIGYNQIKSGTGTGGAYYGISMAGANDSNIVTNNKIENFYLYGVYISAGTANRILNNEIFRSTKTTYTTFYGIYTTGVTPAAVISGNKIHSPGDPSGTTHPTLYCLYPAGDGTATAPVLVSNNIVYNLNKGNGIYGIYLLTSPYTNVYHNTVVIDQPLVGTTALYGIYASGTNTATNISNNNVVITSGNTGTKYGFYYAAAASVADAQRNNFYINSSQTGTQNYGYYTTAYATRTAFQAAYPALEVGSLTVDPLFLNASQGNLLPANSLLGSNGINLTATVPTDINGALRGALPTPGAFEIPSITGPNAGVSSVITPTGIFCAGMQPVNVSVMNAGTTQLTAFQIQWTLNNVPQVPYTFSGAIDTIGGLGQFIDTLTIGTVNIPAGANAIKAWVVLSGDVSSVNDTIQATVTPSVFTVATLSDSVCSGASSTVNLSPSTGYTTGMIQWQISTNGTSFTNIPSSDFATWTQTNMTGSRWFRAAINSGLSGCFSDSVKVNVVETNILGSTPGSRCGSGTVNLAATASPGSVVTWYDVPTGGTALNTGNTFTTPSITATTTYYAASEVSTAKNVGKLTPTSALNLTASPRGLYFNANQTFQIVSVTLFSTAAAGGTGVVTLYDNNHNPITTASISWPGGGSTATPLAQVVPIGITVNPGQNYSLMMTTFTGGGISYETGMTQAMFNTYISPGGACEILGSKTSLTGTASYTTYYYFYDWVISSACASARTPVAATVNAGPSVSGAGASRCGTGTLTLTASSTATGATFNWYTTPTGGASVFTGASFTTPSITTSTTYYVTATTAGCESDRIPVLATVNATPVATAVGASRCGAGTVTLTASSATTGAVFNWYATALGGTPLFTGASFVTPSLINSTTYYVDATNGGCTGIRVPATATVNANPVVSLGSDTAYCAGDSVTITAVSSLTNFVWDNASTSAIRTVGAAGTYYVQVTDANNCLGYDTIVVTENALPVVILGNDTAICDGDIVTLDAAQAGSTYLWDNNDTTQTRDINTNGVYFVTVTDLNGCSGYDTVEVTVVPPPTGTIGSTDNGSGAYSFAIVNPVGVIGNKWDFGDQSASSNSASISHTYNENGTYTVTLTLYGQCDTVVITEVVNVEGLSIRGNDKLLADLLLYPNPATHAFVIENRHNYLIKEVVVYNMLGQIVMQSNANNTNRHEVKVPLLPAGIYTVKVITDKGNLVRKLELIK